MKTLLFGIVIGLFVALSASAQTWNSNAGGYNTGYGTVYGTFGLAQATQNMYNTMQMNMQRTMMRQSMIKKWGLAAVEKAEREAAAGRTSSKPAASNPAITVAPRRAPKNSGSFLPDSSVNTGKTIADAVGETPDEKKLIQAIFTATKQAFDQEVVRRGWKKNNLAAAFTFFMVSNVTVFHDAEEPADETVNALYDAIDQTLDEVPDFAKMTNRDKQGLNNTLIGLAGIPLATYMEGKNANNDAATLKVASALAGEMIKIVLKVEPTNVRFTNGTLVFAK